MSLFRLLQNVLIYVVSLDAVEYDDDGGSFLQMRQRNHWEKEVICIRSPKL